jgi:surface carbohydrate biosynthesis protein
MEKNMLQRKADVLALVWTSSLRDHNLLMPVCIGLQEKHGLNVKYDSVFNGLAALMIYRPKLLLVANGIGSKVAFEIVKYAFLTGVKVVSLISEGNVSEESPSEYLWGHNFERKFYVDKLCVWSERSRKIFEKVCENSKNIITTSGNTGIDRYQFMKFINKKEFLEKINKKKYVKVVGFAGWGFDLFADRDYYHRSIQMGFTFGITNEQVEMHRQDKEKLKGIYKELIENNKDTLFILRFHPGLVYEDETEFYGLCEYENVYVSKASGDLDLGIADIINASDIWIGYESSTALEAWLLGKKTFLINPSGDNFKREAIHKGSPRVGSAEKAQELLNHFFVDKEVEGFTGLLRYRQELIYEMVGWDDGCNHLRACSEVIKLFNSDSARGFEPRLPSAVTIKYQIKYWLAPFKWLYWKSDRERLIRKDDSVLMRKYQKQLRGFWSYREL